jgi:hypothetical protein
VEASFCPFETLFGTGVAGKTRVRKKKEKTRKQTSGHLLFCSAQSSMQLKQNM